MDDKLTKKIERLLINAVIKTDEKDNNYRPTGFEASMAFGGQSNDLVTDVPESWELVNEHAGHLLKLVQQLTQKEVEALDGLLMSRIGGSYRKQIVDAATLYFIHSAKIERLIQHLKKTLKGYSNNDGLLRALDCLRNSMRHRPDLFSEDIAEQIYDWCQECLYGDSKLAKDMREYRSLYEDVIQQLDWLSDVANEILTKTFIKQIDSAFNPELNTDEQRVLEEIESIGFPLDLNESFQHINNLIEQANTPMKYRDSLSAIRVFTERFYEQVARAIDSKTKVDGKDAETVAKFFKTNKLLSHDMADLLTAHRHFLSNDGTHRIKSRKEDARIAKNMTVELCLYIITRLREVNG